VDTSELNAAALPNTTRKREGCNKRNERPQPHHTNNRKIPFQTTNKQKKNNTCETCDLGLDERRTSSCRIYSTTHHNGKRRGHREGERRESTLTASHRCHRPSIPFRHVLIERSCVNKHCKKREGCNKKKTKPTPQTTTKVPFQTTNKIKRTIRVRLVTRRTSSCRIYPTTQQQREHLLQYIVVTAPVFHLDTS